MAEDKSKYYRPVWTSGSYNEEKQTAILYNLIEGVSHYFDSVSAVVIGSFIAIGRNKEIELSKISQATNIPVEDLDGFAHELCRLGLLTKKVLSNDEIVAYRKAVAENNKLNYNRNKVMPSGVETMELGLNGAEEDYAKSID